MSKSTKTGFDFGGQNFASFRRKHELFLGHFFGCHEIFENSAPVLVYEAGASVRAQKSLKKRRSTNRHKSPGNVGSGLLSAFGAIRNRTDTNTQVEIRENPIKVHNTQRNKHAAFSTAFLTACFPDSRLGSKPQASAISQCRKPSWDLV